MSADPLQFLRSALSGFNLARCSGSSTSQASTVRVSYVDQSGSADGKVVVLMNPPLELLAGQFPSASLHPTSGFLNTLVNILLDGAANQTGGTNEGPVILTTHDGVSF